MIYIYSFLPTYQSPDRPQPHLRPQPRSAPPSERPTPTHPNLICSVTPFHLTLPLPFPTRACNLKLSARVLVYGPPALPPALPSSVCSLVYFGGGSAYSGDRSDTFGVYTYVGLDSECEPYWQHSSGDNFLYKHLSSVGEVWYIGSDITANGGWWYSSTGVTNDPTEASNWQVSDGSGWSQQSDVDVWCGESLAPVLPPVLPPNPLPPNATQRPLPLPTAQTTPNAPTRRTR